MGTNYEERQKVYWNAVKKWGKNAQAIAAVEEFSELNVELTKIVNCKRNMGVKEDRDKLVDELADASIMLEQMINNFFVEEQVIDRRDFKIEKLKNILKM